MTSNQKCTLNTIQCRGRAEIREKGNSKEKESSQLEQRLKPFKKQRQIEGGKQVEKDKKGQEGGQKGGEGTKNVER